MTVSYAAAIATCAVLGWSGLSKVHSFQAFVASLGELQLQRRAAEVAAVIVVACEIGVPLSVVVGLIGIGAVQVVILAVSFAAAGAWAAVRHLNVPCRCLGSVSRRRIGWHQVALLPLWAVGAYSVSSLPTSTFETRLDVMVIALVAMTLLRSFSCMQGFSRARNDRRAYAGG
ncbi:MauE/DoxX family redox-associated membrane protein [Gaiella occulta]|uniref:MauE/DoxX family redox-associated membrane protein n=1 Tax=Gaiella occulta TaxID=1002870 RepID=UPI003BEEED16